MNLRWKIAQAAEIRWWQRYLKGKDKEEYLRWKQNYWSEFLRKTGLQLTKGSRVLDAGCGPAGIFIILTQLNVTAIDPLLDYYHSNLKHFDPTDYPEVNFKQISLEAFEESKSFEYIFCLNAINHVADIDLAMDRLVELLKPGGKLVLSIDTHNHKWLKTVFRLFPGDILHPHQYDLEDYQSMLEIRGCKIQTLFLQKKEWIFNYHVLVATR